MLGVKVLAVALAVATLAPGALAWTQAHGDGGRNALVALPPGPLDVLSVGVVPGRQPGDVIYTYAGAVLETPEGIVALLWPEGRSGGECQLSTFSLDGSEPPLVRPIRGCAFGAVAAYHRPRASCSYASTPSRGPRSSRPTGRGSRRPCGRTARAPGAAPRGASASTSLSTSRRGLRTRR